MADRNNQTTPTSPALFKHTGKAALFIVFMLTCLLTIAQRKHSAAKTKTFANLVANGNFEDINVCTEFKALCEPEGWFFIPVYSMMPQGNDSSRFEVLCVGNVTYGFLGNSFLYTKLLCPLIAENKYRFSMWIATPLNEFEQLGVWFGNRDPMNSKTIGDLGLSAFTLTPNDADSVKRKWRRYSYTFTAKGGEQFMMLGNFSTTPLSKSNVAVNKNGDVLYSIDNVKLFPLDANERLCSQYYAVASQVYEQDRRHPAIPLDKAPVDSLASATRKLRSGNDAARSAAKKEIFIPPAIQFDVDSSSISPAYADTLDAMINVLKQRSFNKIIITGHTDDSGRPADNEKLSVKRAEAVKQYLQPHFNNIAIETAGAADTQPVANNNTPEGRQKNRRAEVKIVSSE